MTIEFIPLKGFEEDYEIMTTYPYNIRSITTKKYNYGVHAKRDGIKINLNGKIYLKHRLIAKQFMPNYIDNKPIYHINGDKLDNHIDNLTYNR